MADSATVAIGIAGVSLLVTIAREVFAATRTSAKDAKEDDKEIAAIRTKIYEVELWVRDNCVRAPDFRDTIAAINRNIEMMGIKMDTGLQRIEMKLEKLQEHKSHAEA